MRLKKPEVTDVDYEDRKDKWSPLPRIEPLIKLFQLNVGLILTNGDLGDVKEVIERHGREAPAKPGQIA
jgi:hypothetical protein